MARRITIIQGHPDPAGDRFCHALANAYAAGATGSGHQVRRIETARIDFPVLRTQGDFMKGTPPQAIVEAQEAISWAEHVVIVFPLWLGTMPALLKAFLEQTIRPGLAYEYSARGYPRALLAGRSARIVVTMGMPAFVYRWYFFAHGLRGLERNILGFVGFSPIRENLFGTVDADDPARRRGWLDRMKMHGMRGD